MRRKDGIRGEEKGFTLLEVIVSMVAIGLFLMLVIDPVLSVQKQRIQLLLDVRRLDEMASDQVAERRTGYQIKEGAWCIEALCLASAVRNDSPRNLTGPLAEPVVAD